MEDRPLNAQEMHPSTAQTPPSNRPDTQTTIGFLTANIHLGIGRRLWRAVVHTAARQSLSLICFPSEGLRAPTEFEAQRNVIYDLVNPAHLSGLVNWSSTITGSLEPADVIAFHQRYRSLPMVSLSQPVWKIPTGFCIPGSSTTQVVVC